jgi:flavin-dependent dehydrogenase
VIELHAFAGGYCGVLSEENGAVNVCWISHEDALRNRGGTPDAMIRQLTSEKSELASRLSQLERRGDFHAASQLSFRPKDLFPRDVCMIGDAAGMIAPLCGDGMAMALTSGEFVAPLISDYLRSKIGLAAFKAVYARTWHSHFRTRMRVGRLVHAGYTRPAVAEAGVRLCAAVPDLAGLIVNATRG